MPAFINFMVPYIKDCRFGTRDLLAITHCVYIRVCAQPTRLLMSVFAYMCIYQGLFVLHSYFLQRMAHLESREMAQLRAQNEEV